MNQMPILAIIVPCYNEEKIIEQSAVILLNKLSNLINSNRVSTSSFISFVDDGSTDKTWKIIQTLSEKEHGIKGIRLAYNMGHQIALTSGICENNADIYITLDCDLQDDINIMDEMIDKWTNNDIDVVYGVRNSRETDTFVKRTMENTY